MAKPVVKGHDLRVAEFEAMLWQVINQSGFADDTSTVKFVIGNIYNNVVKANSQNIIEQRNIYMMAKSKEKEKGEISDGI